jgi:hypothetical protein
LGVHSADAMIYLLHTAATLGESPPAKNLNTRSPSR